ncbi:MAG: hypothetical protein JNK57_14520 [Planctomycetaceae bacterium]|nr:hypothetical protein [Planctomycetaceae bacterium]
MVLALQQLAVIVRWPLAILTSLLICAGPFAAYHVLNSWNHGNSHSSEFVFPPILFVGSAALIWWHRNNLTEYLSYRAPLLVDVLAHISAASFVFLGSFSTWLGAVIFVGKSIGLREDGLKICVGLAMVVLLPFLYYSGRVVADFLSADWSRKVIDETSSSSAFHPDNQFRSQGYTTEIPRDHWISFCLTGVPAIIVIVSGLFVYHVIASRL